MITILNEELFEKVTEHRDGKNGKPDYFRTIISSSIESVDKKDPTVKCKRVVDHVLHTAEDNFNKENTRILVDWTTNRPFVKINQGDRNRYDAPVYMIAIPYNGFIAPIEKSNAYRIYKAFTIRSEKKDIEFQDHMYGRVAYMTVVPNVNLFADDQETEEVEMEIQVFGMEGKDTVKTTWTIHFRKDEVTSFVTYQSEIVDPVNSDDYLGKKVFPIYTGYRPKDGDDKSKPRKKNYKSRGSSNGRPSRYPYQSGESRTVVDGGGLGNTVCSSSILEDFDKPSNYSSKKKKKKKGKRR